MKLDSISDILAELRLGNPIVLVDDAERENEGDIVVAAEKITPELIAFMMNEGKGLICLSFTEERREQLGIPLQAKLNSSVFGTNFAASFDHRSVVPHGETAAGRAKTILETANPQAKAADFVIPGYVIPVCALPGGVLKRRGQTEGSVDLMRLAGLAPIAVICEIMGTNGEMMRGAELAEFCEKFSLRITSVQALVEYRLKNELAIRRVAQFEALQRSEFKRLKELSAAFEGSSNNIKVVIYNDDVDDKEHFALVWGKPQDGILVRIHSECLTGDIFESRRCDCGNQLEEAVKQIAAAGNGVIIYLCQEGRGIGLGNKLRAYELQDGGLDTVDANLKLGFEADEREYRVAAHILGELGVSRVRLMTNNPKKLAALSNFGLTVDERVPLLTPMDDFNSSYLDAKKNRLGHLLNDAE